MHPFADPRRIGKACGDDVPRSNTGTAHGDVARRIEPEHVERLEDLNEFVAEAVLEGNPAGIDPPWDEEDLLVFHVHAFDRPDAGGEDERLGLAERLGREPPTRFLPYDGRVQAFFDGRPDRESRTEVVAFDNEVRPVPDTDLIDRGEQLVHRIPGEDVGQARLDTHSHERKETTFLPFRAERELLVTEFDSGLRVGVLGMGARK